MIRAGVLGSPISHSLSPLIHTLAFDLLAIEGDYRAFEIVPADLEDFLSAHIEMTGFSVTMPLKEKAAELAAKKSVVVQQTYSANTLIRKGDHWSAENTDVSGFSFLFERLGIPEDKSKVAIVGAGATARSAIYAAKLRGATTTIFRRSNHRDESIYTVDRDSLILDWNELDKPHTFDVVINTTPVGSLGNVRPALDTELVIDSIYHPWPTEFASLIIPRRTFIAGEYLLAAQALQQISLFTHQSFDAGVMFETLLTALSQALHR